MDGMDRIRAKRRHRMLLRVLSAIGISIALSGCIVVPYEPHHYHPYRYGYY